MSRELAIRALSLYLPLVAAALAWVVRHGCIDVDRDARRTGVAALLASAWCAPSLLAVHVLAQSTGWWRFDVESGLVAGVPLDLYLGWIVLWGALPVIAFRAWPVSAIAAIMIGVDLLVMPLCEPVVRLGPWWVIGEAIAAAIVLVPALCLARWTIDDTHLAARTVLQMIAFTGLMLLVIPSAIFEQVGGGWTPLRQRSAQWNSVLLQLLAIPAVVGLSAVQEFVTRGHGTPVPYDPPRRLVTSGPYAYVANPMQLAMVFVFAIWAAMLDNIWIAGGSLMTLLYGSGLAGWDEHRDLNARFGVAWIGYRHQVRKWWPRWRPARSLASPRARLYVAQSCATCRGIGEWLSQRALIGLDIVPAEQHPSRDLLRMTYEHAGDGAAEEGVAAFARALEHINLAWAWLGMLMRLPLVGGLLQLITDACGGDPRRIPRLSQAPIADATIDQRL